jgi:3-oxoacyl-[acyl-carrier protein] reductase
VGVVYDFAGRVAVVTGGANGIGRRVAERLVAAGAKVDLWDVGEAELAGASASIVDVTDPGTIARATDKVVAGRGGIDILVHAAGVLGPAVPVDACDPSLWRRLIEVNLVGTYEVARHIVPVMRRKGRGRIVNFASIAGKEGTPNASAYSAAKAGVIAFTKSLAKELAATEILVNCVAPGPIDTDMLKQTSAEQLAAMMQRCPKGRRATVDECAELVLWLVSDACTFNTGAAFDLTGGRATY